MGGRYLGLRGQYLGLRSQNLGLRGQNLSLRGQNLGLRGQNERLHCSQGLRFSSQDLGLFCFFFWGGAKAGEETLPIHVEGIDITSKFTCTIVHLLRIDPLVT